MKKYLAMAVGAAFAAAATIAYAQTTPTPPGTDRPAGEEGGTSAKPNMDKKQGTGTKAAPKAGGTPTPPGTDRPAGESGGTSAKSESRQEEIAIVRLSNRRHCAGQAGPRQRSWGPASMSY